MARLGRSFPINRILSKPVISTGGGGADLNIAVTDNVTVSDSVTAFEPFFAVGVVDNVTVSDSTQELLTSFITVNDNITVAESQNTILVNNISVVDNLTVQSHRNGQITSFVTVTDNITVSDSIQELMVSFVSVLDNVTVSDSTSVVITSGASELNISVSDGIVVSESLNFLQTSFITVNDSLTVSDSVGLFESLSITVTDNVTVSESRNTTLVYNVNKSDNVTTSDSVTLFEPFFSINVSDLIFVLESVGAQRRTDVVAQCPSVTMHFICYPPQIQMYVDTTVMLDSEKQYYSATYGPNSNYVEYPQSPAGYALNKHVVMRYRYPNLFILRDGSVVPTQVLATSFEAQDPVKTYLWGAHIVVVDSFDVTALTNAGYSPISVGAV